MSNAPLKLFLTGDPGCGKTTVLRRVVERLREEVSMVGFLTEEVRHGGRREGFRGVTLDGAVFPLASRAEDGEPRVGPYVVELSGLETIGLAALEPRDDTRLVVLDEIGKMEMLSEPFRRRVESLLDSEAAVLASIAVHGVGLVRRLRNDPRVTLVRMRRHTSDAMVGDLIRRLRDAGVAPPRRKSPAD